MVNSENKVELMTAKEVAAFLRVKYDAFRQRIKAGMYKGLYFKDGKNNLFIKSKLEEYIEKAAS